MIDKGNDPILVLAMKNAWCPTATKHESHARFGHNIPMAKMIEEIKDCPVEVYESENPRYPDEPLGLSIYSVVVNEKTRYMFLAPQSGFFIAKVEADKLAEAIGEAGGRSRSKSL